MYSSNSGLIKQYFDALMQDYISKLIRHCLEGDELERLAAYFSLLFLYHEECDPLPEAISSFQQSLSQVLNSLGFERELVEKISLDIKLLLHDYRKVLNALDSYDLVKSLAQRIKYEIRESLKELSKELVNLHLRRLSKVISQLKEDEKRSLRELRECLMKQVVKEVDVRVYGLKLGSVDVGPLVEAIGERVVREIFPHMKPYDVEKFLEKLGLCIIRYSRSRRHYYPSLLIFPAMFTDGFVSLLEGVQKPFEELKPLSYKGIQPSREILESIVADVLKSLGFQVETNKRLGARGRGEIEVDVWGTKLIGTTRLYVYASCKNWNREVDRSVIDEEFGRTLQLIQIPHLKIFVARKLTEPARNIALSDGFIIIELGEKASTNNAEEIYHIIYKHLREVFTGIAPPELQRIAMEAKEISERLRLLAEEIERISS